MITYSNYYIIILYSFNQINLNTIFILYYLSFTTISYFQFIKILVYHIFINLYLYIQDQAKIYMDSFLILL